MSILVGIIQSACNREISDQLPRCRYPECIGACDVASTSVACLKAALPFPDPTGRLTIDLDRLEALIIELHGVKL
jgi:hypothetical protein